MVGGTDQAQRRLSAAAFKIEQFLQHLDKIAESGFPHDDGKTALADIRAVFVGLTQKQKGIPEGADPLITDQFFREVRDLVEIYTRVLGIILRSTNLRNNFEVYFPLKNLAKQFLGNGVRLLISSEWDFIPFTYPMNIEDVPNLILVGSPATEAQNLLVTPLAGHEIGHSVWAQEGVRDRLDERFKEVVEAYFKRQPKKLVRAIKAVPDLFQELYQEQVEDRLVRKAEEAFCDLVGLRLFGAAYMYAFEYYMAPGRAKVSPDYPSDSVRIEILRKCAKAYGVAVPADLFEGWKEPGLQQGANALYDIADDVLLECIDDLSEIVVELFDKANVGQPRQEKIQIVEKSFKRYEPFGGEAWFSEIVNALWICAAEMRLRDDVGAQKMLSLTEIALKSVEVSELQTEVVPEIRTVS